MLQVDQLLIVAGPSCSGKTGLIEGMLLGACGSLCAQLGVTRPASWVYSDAWRLKEIRSPSLPRLMVHYDLCVHYSQKIGFRHIKRLIKNCKQATIVTMCASTETLRRRNNARIFSLARVDSTVVQRFFRILKRRQMYKTGFSTFVYEKWFDFLESFHEADHWLLDGNLSSLGLAQRYDADNRPSLL